VYVYADFIYDYISYFACQRKRIYLIRIKYRKKRNKRSDAHDVMADKTFNSIVHALRLSGINIPKNALLPSQLSAPVSSSEEEDMDCIEEEDGMTVRKNMRMSGRKMAESKIIGMPTVTKRMKCIVILDHLCWTQ
jgi:hypothetical protein